jgi:hypothetical protein
VKPCLMLLKKDVGRSVENPKVQVLFVVIDFDKSEVYPSNFVCMLPTAQGLFAGHSIFSKLFGDDGLPLAKKLLVKALSKESDLDTKTAIESRIKLLNPKKNFRSRCRICKNPFYPESLNGHYHKTCQKCKSRMKVSA